MKIKWSGLADKNYYDHIARYCLPSWKKLPGEKYIIHDCNLIGHEFLKVIPWYSVNNANAPFLKLRKERKKVTNFWRKMQSQVWAVRNISDCDVLVLLDTDIEVLDFNKKKFSNLVKDFLNTDYIWATGTSQRRGHDSGFIIFNMSHPRLNELIDHYENIWDSGEIYNLEKSYDGHAVESMFELYPSYKVPNIDYGNGFHVYDLGFVHYGSKIPKSIRRNSKESGSKIVEQFTANRQVKILKSNYNSLNPEKDL